MYLIAGLGNPSLKYRHTRHNVGFDALEYLAKKYSIPVKKKKYFGLLGEGKIEGERVLLLKPQTYMNKSGESISAALTANQLSAEDSLIVLVDDIALDCGYIRIRERGSAGGHNGLKSIIACCGTEGFKRIRIGAGKLPEGGDMVRHVLSRPNRTDTKMLSEAYVDVADACRLLLSGKTEAAMNSYNGKQKSRKLNI